MAVSNLVVDDTDIDAATATSGSSFYLAMRILPAAQRDAMYQVYAFCRAVDDIADSDLPRAERAAGLEQWRADIDACYAGQPRVSLRALTRHIHTFHLQREDFHAMIDGMMSSVASVIFNCSSAFAALVRSPRFEKKLLTAVRSGCGVTFW